MRHLRILFTFLLVASMSLGYGQNYVFKVLANKGTNEIKQGGKWERLRTGATLHKGDEIKVSEEAYIGLVHSGGHAMEWVKPGKFKVSEIEASVPKFSSATAKYAEYLASKMESKGTDGIVGGVRRDLGAGIQIFSPDDQSVYNNEVVIRWEPLEGENISYKLKVTDMYDEIVVEEQTSETSYKLDLSQPKIEESLIVLVSVTSYGGKSASSKQIAIKRLSENQKGEIVNSLVPLMKELNNETAIAKYILAGFFEENGLILDAVNYYEAAIRIAPEVQNYRDAYDYFLLRNGLRKKTEK